VLKIQFIYKADFFIHSNPIQTPTPSPTSKAQHQKPQLMMLKKCIDIGLKPGTKKFKECVVELM